MKRRILYLAQLFLFPMLAAGCSQEPRFEVTNALLISNATILSANEDEVILDYVGHVLIDSGTIVYSGENLPTIRGACETLDASGQFLTPGLIDSHVHLAHAIAFSDEQYETKSDLVRMYFEQLPKSYLYFGFTSVIDLDLRDRTKKQFEQIPLKPDIYGAGRGVRYFDGYGQSLFPAPLRYKIFPKWIYDTNQQDRISEDVDLHNHTIESIIQQTLNEDAVVLKTYYEKGFGGAFDWPVPSDSLLKSLVVQAHAHSLPVAMHATSIDAYEKGILADIDIFAHGMWHWGRDALNTTPTTRMEKLYEKISKNKKFIQPTLRVILGEYDTYNWSTLTHPDVKHVLTADFLEWLGTSEAQWSQKELIELYNNNKPDSTISNDRYFQAANQRVLTSTKMAYDKGVKLILGSDTPAAEGIGNVPGLNGYMEIQAMSQAGIDNATIFIAATIRNAVAFGLHDTIGSIEVGKKANLLLLNSNPLIRIESWNEIDSIILAGVLYKREKFSAASAKK